MAGENPTQAAVPEITNLTVALKQYAQVSSLLQQDQQKVLAQLIMGLKPPSVFKSGSWFDKVGNYPLAPIGNAGQAFFGINNASPNVFILNLQDANKVRLIFNTSEAFLGTTNFLAYALSPSDLTNQVPADQFSLFQQIDGLSIQSGDGQFASSTTFSGTADITGMITPVTGAVDETFDPTGITAATTGSQDVGASCVLQISDEIFCSGNQYIHIFGVIDDVDAYTALSSNPSANFFSYALIK